MPKQVEECVRKLKGKNKRTGKPYTESEKWAICTAMHNKNKKATFEEEVVEPDEEIAAAVENGMAQCMRKMMNSGRAKTTEDAKQLCEAMMARSGFDVNNLELILTRELP